MNAIGHLILTEEHSHDSMAWAREMFNTVPDGSVLIAKKLSKARGRQGRTWITADGQITNTIVLKPIIATVSIDASLAALNMALSIGLLAPFKKFKATLKWPNDLIINEKKIGGMLFENLWMENSLAGVIFAFSVNVNNSCKTNPELASIATSIQDETQISQNLGELQVAICASLSIWYDHWKAEKNKEIFQQWRTSQYCLGKAIKIHDDKGVELEGIAQDVLPNGNLVLHVLASDKTLVIPFSQVESIQLPA